MSGKNITVVDLEWNSALPGEKKEQDAAADMMFEIIEIGAVRLSPALEVMDAFHRNVRPVLHKKMQRYIGKLTGRTQHSLYSGDYFPEVFRDFLAFAGDDAVIASWGNSDPEVLRSNLTFHHMEKPPLWEAVDVQQIFSALAEERLAGSQRSVEYALDFLRLPKNFPFHEAISDARYEAMILKETLEPLVSGKPARERLSRYEALIRPYLYSPWMHRQTDLRVEFGRDDLPVELLKTMHFTCPACGRALNLLTLPRRDEHPPVNGSQRQSCGAESGPGAEVRDPEDRSDADDFGTGAGSDVSVDRVFCSAVEDDVWMSVKKDRIWFAMGMCPEHGKIEILAKRARRSRDPLLNIRVRIPQGPSAYPSSCEEGADGRQKGWRVF